MANDAGKDTDSDALRVETMDTEALLVELGTHLSAADLPSLHARPPSPSELAERARQWLAAERATLQRLICGNDSIRTSVAAQPSMKRKLIGLLCDSVSAFYAIVPVVTLAEILYRDGLKELCSKEWADGAPR